MAIAAGRHGYAPNIEIRPALKCHYLTFPSRAQILAQVRPRSGQEQLRTFVGRLHNGGNATGPATDNHNIHFLQDRNQTSGLSYFITNGKLCR